MDASPVVVTEDKTAAIVSYLTLIGFLVAVILHSQKKTKLGAFHLRQTLGIFLTGIAGVFCQMVLLFIPFVGWLAMLVLWCGVFAMWVMGLISAVNGQMKPVPVLGPLYQQWFGNAFE